MIEVNAVFKVGNKTLRILAFDANREQFLAIDIWDKKAQPFKGHTIDLAEKIAKGSAKQVDDPMLELIPRIEEISETARQRVEEVLWPAVGWLMDRLPELGTPSRRGKLVREAAERSGLSKPTIRYQLRRLLQGGGTKAALTPHYHERGRPRSSHLPRKKKIGCPRKILPGTGVNATREDRALIARVFKKAAPKKLNRKTLRSIYARFIAERLAQLGKNPEDPKDVEAALGSGVVITYDVFAYHVMRSLGKSELAIHGKISRKTRRAARSLLDRSLNDAPLPGYRYQIDATVVDLYLVSRYDRQRIVGRPTLYLVVDVATTLIVGYYLSLDKPSWGAAVMAIINVAEDKVELCRRYGFEITEEQWPAAPMPLHLLGDRGEMLSYVVDALPYHLGIDVENAPPYSGESKACVERSFGTLQPEFTTFAPGAVEDLEPGEGDYRLEAVLNIDELRSILLRAIVIANNEIKRGLAMTDDAVRADLPAVPAKLWNYYRSRGHLHGKFFKPEHIALYARPRRTVKVTRHGIHFAPGLDYASPAFTQAPWYHAAMQKGETLEATYDPQDMSEIVVWSPVDKDAYTKCQLVDRCKAYLGLSWREVNLIRRGHRQANGRNRPRAEATAMVLQNEIFQQIEQAKREAAAEAGFVESKSARLSNIRENNRAERVLDKLDARQAELPDGILDASDEPGGKDDENEHYFAALNVALSDEGAI